MSFSFMQVPYCFINKKRPLNMVFFIGVKDGTFARATIPDKQWVTTVYPYGKFASKFSPHSSPIKFLTNQIKKHQAFSLVLSYLV